VLDTSRSCSYIRETKETRVEVSLDIDNRGDVIVSTPIPFLNHMLTTLFSYMNASVAINAVDKFPFDDHHVAEDVAIAVGEALNKCLGDRVGIRRFSHIVIPMDDALMLVSIDISGRGRAYVELNTSRESIGGLAIENLHHFIDTLASRAGITIHIQQLRGVNTHHVIEALFKGLGITLYEATRVVDPGFVRSTKGVLNG